VEQHDCEEGTAAALAAMAAAEAPGKFESAPRKAADEEEEEPPPA
jgi:sugar (pentulose or hexulose) kinase